jgi:uncharacterized protein (TIGR00297 family)
VNLGVLLAVGALLNGIASVVAFRRGSVDAGGAIAGAAVGAVIFGFGGPLWWIVLMVFFVTATAAGRVRHREKAWLSSIHQKGERRDLFQVLANGGLGALTAVLYRVTGNPSWAAAFAVSFAASNADTWASEIGVLSRADPVSLAGFRRLPRGISGGVTFLGTTAALVGGLLIGAVFGLENLSLRVLPAGFLRVFLFVGAGGFAGSLVDSLLGATVQARYASPDAAPSAPPGAVGPATERRRGATGAPNRLVHGLAFVNNDVVNFVSGVVVTGLAALLASRLF